MKLSDSDSEALDDLAIAKLAAIAQEQPTDTSLTLTECAEAYLRDIYHKIKKPSPQKDAEFVVKVYQSKEFLHLSPETQLSIMRRLYLETILKVNAENANLTLKLQLEKVEAIIDTYGKPGVPPPKPLKRAYVRRKTQ